MMKWMLLCLGLAACAPNPQMAEARAAAVGTGFYCEPEGPASRMCSRNTADCHNQASVDGTGECERADSAWCPASSGICFTDEATCDDFSGKNEDVGACAETN